MGRSLYGLRVLRESSRLPEEPVLLCPSTVNNGRASQEHRYEAQARKFLSEVG